MKRKELVQKKCLYIIHHQPHLIRLRYIQIYHFTDLVNKLQVVVPEAIFTCSDWSLIVSIFMLTRVTRECLALQQSETVLHPNYDL